MGKQQMRVQQSVKAARDNPKHCLMADTEAQVASAFNRDTYKTRYAAELSQLKGAMVQEAQRCV